MIVAKFGGTSVAQWLKSTGQHNILSMQERKPVVILSAMAKV
jgi:aspartokinase